MHALVCVHIHACIYMRKHAHAYMHACAYPYAYICIYAYACAYIFVHELENDRDILKIMIKYYVYALTCNAHAYMHVYVRVCPAVVNVNGEK